MRNGATLIELVITLTLKWYDFICKSHHFIYSVEEVKALGYYIYLLEITNLSLNEGGGVFAQDVHQPNDALE